MNYKKPSKNKANEDYLIKVGFNKEQIPYLEKKFQTKKSFLIFCEGKNTEPLYFKSFPVPTNTVIIEGDCFAKTKLVNLAIEKSKNEKYKGREVWCVFDYDIKPDEPLTQPQDFNNAIKKAEANGMKVAWSNDSFELWFVLHYQKLDAKVTREELYSILKREWNLKDFTNNAKKPSYCSGHYERHGGSESNMQKLAIKRAKELHKSYKGMQDFSNLCPCTTVYLLVEELNKNLKR